MRILITGGAGFVGTTLIPALLNEGHSVRVMDNLTYGGDPLLPFFPNKRFEFIRGDIRNQEDLKTAVANQDAIIHLAALVGYPACRSQPKLAREINVDGSKNVIAATSTNQLLVYASTGSNYGHVKDICTEESPLNPFSDYGVTKTEAEKLFMETGRAVAFRFATAFGVSPRMRLDLMINDFLYKAITMGYLIVYEKHFMRTFIHVSDMARAFQMALKNANTMRGQVYNVGNEALNLTKEQICELIKSKIECYIHYADVGEDKDKRNYVVSYKKINDLGFSTKVTIEEGVDELIRAAAAIHVELRYSNA